MGAWPLLPYTIPTRVPRVPSHQNPPPERPHDIVVSRKAVLEEQMGADRESIIGTLSEGAVVKGIIKNITDYGAFVDLGGIDGLLHITDLAWKRIKHPSEVLNVGDEIEAKVLKYDQEKNRVSLGLKQLGDDPWIGLERRYPVNTRIFGKVSNTPWPCPATGPASTSSPACSSPTPCSPSASCCSW